MDSDIKKKRILKQDFVFLVFGLGCKSDFCRFGKGDADRLVSTMFDESLSKTITSMKRYPLSNLTDMEKDKDIVAAYVIDLNLSKDGATNITPEFIDIMRKALVGSRR